MFDDTPVHRAMERIFTPLEITAVARPAADRSRSVEASPPPRRRRWFLGKDGIAATGFALAITGIGLVMGPLLTTQTAPPVPIRTVAPTPTPIPVSPLPAPIPAPVMTPAIPAPVATPAPTAIAAPAPVPTIRPAKAVRAKPIRRRYARPRPYRHYRRREAPHLAGAALRRALARDVVITRRLNQEALRRLPSAPR